MNTDFHELIRRDKRFRIEAYIFIFESLRYAQEVLGMGVAMAEPNQENDAVEISDEERHISGQELCEAVRCFALDQFGLLAKTVLHYWGIHATRDFGEIVYNLIEIGELRKNDKDSIEDFDSVFDFDEGLLHSFQIELPKPSKRWPS